MRTGLVKAASLLGTGAVAASVGYQLNDHHVSGVLTGAAVALVAWGGISSTAQMSRTRANQTFTCLAEDCGVSISVVGVTPAELAAFERQVAEHSRRHGGVS